MGSSWATEPGNPLEDLGEAMVQVHRDVADVLPARPIAEGEARAVQELAAEIGATPAEVSVGSPHELTGWPIFGARR